MGCIFSMYVFPIVKRENCVVSPVIEVSKICFFKFYPETKNIYLMSCLDLGGTMLSKVKYVGIELQMMQSKGIQNVICFSNEIIRHSREALFV